MKPNSRSDTCINWARILLQRMQGFKDYPEEFAVAPELLIRETTAPQITGAVAARPEVYEPI